MMTFRTPERLKHIQEHFGIILLIYGFANFLGFIREFVSLLSTSPLFASVKMGMWVIIMVTGFVLSFPVLEQHIFRQTRELQEQGMRVFEGFDGMRIPLGLIGLILAGIMLLSQFGLF